MSDRGIHTMSSRYETLDGLRGVGALWVLLLHFAPDLGLPAPGHGYLAVDLFFCLSGFVLTKSYARRIHQGMGFGQWLSVRLIRLYPLYFLSIVLGALATAVPTMPGGQLDPLERGAALMTGLLMLPSPTWRVMPELFPLNFVAWSLFVEMLLSVLFFWACRWSTRRLWALLAAGAVALILSRIYLGYIGGGFAWRDGPSGLARGLFGFSAGMLIARQDVVRRASTWLACLPILAAAAIMSVRPPHAVAYDLAAIFIAMPAITYCAVRAQPGVGGPFRLAGDLSYAVYALHSVTFFMLVQLGWADPTHPLALPKGLLTLFLFLCGCWLLDRYYDGPIRKHLSDRLRARVERLAAP